MSRFLHTMIRVRDLERSINFYTELLGMKELRRRDVPDGKCALAFVGYEGDPAKVELTYNYGVEKYGQGSAFGHLAGGRAGRRRLRADPQVGRQGDARGRAGEFRLQRDRLRRRPRRLQDRVDRTSLSQSYAATLGQLVELPVTRRLRIGVTGLARAGKTAFLTSVAANLLAQADGNDVLPALGVRLAGRGFRVTVAPAGAEALPRFEYPAHLAALAADPPRWPARTDAVSILALEVRVGWTGLLGALPPRRLVLEFLDYPGEWLLDLPLLGQNFSAWSAQILRRLEAAGGRRRCARLPGVSARPAGARPGRRSAGRDRARALSHGAGAAARRGRAALAATGPVPDAGAGAGRAMADFLPA